MDRNANNNNLINSINNLLENYMQSLGEAPKSPALSGYQSVILNQEFHKVNNAITLGLPLLEDAEEFFNLIQENKALLSENLQWPKYVNVLSDTQNFLTKSFVSHQNNQSKTYLIKFDQELAGTVSFNSFDMPNKTAEIGYWLGARFRGYGIISESINYLIQHYAESGLLQRFVIKCIVSNKASNNVALRCGFEKEGLLKKAEYLNEHYYDQNIYAKILLIANGQ